MRMRKYVWLAVGLAVLIIAILVGGFSFFRARVAGFYVIASNSMAPTLNAGDHVLVNKMAYISDLPHRGDIVVLRVPLRATPGAMEEKAFVERVIGIPGDTIRITRGYIRINGGQYDHRCLRDMLGKDRLAQGQSKIKLVDGRLLMDNKAVPIKEITETIGEPDAKVEIVPGRVYRNGRILDEPYVAEDCDQDYPFRETPREWIVKKKTGDVVKIPKGKLLVMGDNRNDSNDSRYWGLLDSGRLIGRVTHIVYADGRTRQLY